MAKRSASAVSGFARYESFFSAPPSLVLEWHDDRTPAKGWVAINAIKGGAAGGGTRMRPGGTRDEAVFLAKTMQVKFNVCGPAIGGGKSVIDFNPAQYAMDQGAKPGTPAFGREVHKIKTDVLQRWYRHVSPLLKSCYGTGGDVGVDERADVIPITRKTIALHHPQEGIVRGHFPKFTAAQFAKSMKQLNEGVLAEVDLHDLQLAEHWTVADVATGWGVVCSLAAYYKARGETLAGKRVIIEGFGAVGGFTAYYLHQMGAKTVAASSAGGGKDRRGLRIAADADGLDVLKLLALREGTALPSPAADSSVRENVTPDDLFAVKADIFVPAALSHTISARTIELLGKAGVQVLSCGSNNPFQVPPPDASGHIAPLGQLVAHMLKLQRVADREFAIIPDFVANCGMARTFHYLMVPGNKPTGDAVLADIKRTIDKAVKALVPNAAASRNGLLERGYDLFIQ
jgi:glutamate dehydrogenase/leucine dehydrogenase